MGSQESDTPEQLFLHKMYYIVDRIYYRFYGEKYIRKRGYEALSRGEEVSI